MTACGATWTTQSGFPMACELAAGHEGDHAAKVSLRDTVETWTARPDQVDSVLLSAIAKRAQGSQGWHWAQTPSKAERAALAAAMRRPR